MVTNYLLYLQLHVEPVLFATETTCMTESLYRAGTSVSPRGAVAVVGTAQSYTHTAFNNIVNMGIFDGIFLHESSTMEKHIFMVN